MTAALQSTMTASTNLATVTSTSFSSSSFVTSESGRALFTSPVSSSATFRSTLGSHYPSVRCGRGDKRTAKGKRFKGSFGNARPKDKFKSRGLPVTPLPPRPPKKDLDDGDFIQVDLDESLFSG